MSGEIKERPILFSSEMVRAILDGRKTETRRVMRVQPSSKVDWKKFGFSCVTLPGHIEGRGRYPTNHLDPGESSWGTEFFKIPYGVKGDRLYVRETFQFDEHFNELGLSYYPSWIPGIIYKADAELWEDWDQTRWKPSIHMPKKYSRIKIEIKGIGVERVQDIDSVGCIAEGCPLHISDCPHGNNCDTIFECFKKTWDSINKKRGFGWEKNPFVWVIKFKRI
jgi:hypothetical protein